MQAVRSRAAQAQRFCNCSSCLSTTNTLTRRATTVTARRSVPVGDVWTVSLSSLAFGLAFADSKRKNDRRKQWDKVIEEARATVEETEIEQRNRLAALLDARLSALDDHGVVRLDDRKKQRPRPPCRLVVSKGGLWRHGADKLDVVEEDSKALVRWVPIRNKLVAALDAQGSEELVQWMPFLSSQMDALNAEGSEELVQWIPFLSSQMDALNAEESKELVHWVPIRNKLVAALDAQESKELIHWVPFPSRQMNALNSEESKELVHWVPFLSSQIDALNSEESEELVQCIPFLSSKMDGLNSKESEELVHWVSFPSSQMDALNSEESEELVRQTPVSHNEFETWLDVFEWAQEQYQIREASGFQDWKGPPLSLLQSLSTADLHELLADKRLLRHFYGGSDCANLVDRPRPYPLTMKKIRILEWSIAKLVLSLLMYSSKPWDDPGRPTTSLLRDLLGDETIENKIDQIQEHIRILHIDCTDYSYYADSACPPFPNYDRMIVADDEQTREMNKSLHHLLVLMEQSTDPGDVISKICYNLLTARAPPNTETYNMLLLRFSLLAMEGQFTAALISMRQSHIRPNEITNTTALLHFTRMEDRVAFFHTLELMEGHRHGLTAKPRELIPHPMLWERFSLRGINSQMAIEKARMNGQVYESVIAGAMKFVCGGIARQYYRRMVSEGWSPNFGTLLAILQDCCRRVDWTVGYKVLHQLEKTAEKVNTVTYEWMLRLCQCCQQNEFFDQILINGVHCGALPASMLALTDRDKAEDIGFLIKRAEHHQPSKAIGRLEEAAIRIGHRLGYDSPYLMKNIIDGCNDQETLRQTIMRTEKSWRVRYALEKRLDDISRDIEYTFMQASRALRVSESQFFAKHWLSKQVKQLETDLMQAEAADQICYPSYSDMLERQRVEGIQTGTSEDGNSESGNSGNLPLTSHSAENGAEYASRLPPVNEQRHDLVQSNLPDLRPRTYPPSGSIWDAPGEQMAAMA